MFLIVPTVGVESGPQYATDINNSLTLIDQHNHANGNGVQISPDGLNINNTLNIQNQILQNVGAVNLEAQAGTPTYPLSITAQGTDLYYYDGTTNVRITAAGSVNATTSSLSSPPSSAFFSGGTLVVESVTANSTPGNISVASILLANATPSSFALTLSPPNGLSNDYSLTLPVIPGQTNVMTLDTSGNMSSIMFDGVGANMTATGANSILSKLTYIPQAQADIVGQSMGSTGSNAIGSAMDSTGSNSVLSKVNSVSSSVADVIGEAMTSAGASALAVEVNSSSATALVNNSNNANLPGTPTIAGANAASYYTNIGRNVGMVFGLLHPAANGSGLGWTSIYDNTYQTHLVSLTYPFYGLYSIVATPANRNGVGLSPMITAVTDRSFHITPGDIGDSIYFIGVGTRT
jgi:hypothetical protein